MYDMRAQVIVHACVSVCVCKLVCEWRAVEFLRWAAGRAVVPHSSEVLIGLKLESAEDGRNLFLVHTQSHTTKNPRTIAVWLRRASAVWGKRRWTSRENGRKTICISWPLSSALCVSVTPSPSSSPSVINDQPSACVHVYEQTALLSSNVKTTSPAGFLNKYSGFCFFYWAQFVTGQRITNVCYCTVCMWELLILVMKYFHYDDSWAL